MTFVRKMSSRTRITTRSTDREYSFDQGYEWTEEDAWDALTDGMYGDMPSNPLEYDAMMDAMGF